jgi:hypothetical protein
LIRLDSRSENFLKIVISRHFCRIEGGACDRYASPETPENPAAPSSSGPGPGRPRRKVRKSRHLSAFVRIGHRWPRPDAPPRAAC